MARFSVIIMAKDGISRKIFDVFCILLLLKLDDMARKAMLEECYKVRNEIRKSVSSEIYDAYTRYMKNVVERAENGQNNNFAY